MTDSLINIPSASPLVSILNVQRTSQIQSFLEYILWTSMSVSMHLHFFVKILSNLHPQPKTPFIIISYVFCKSQTLSIPIISISTTSWNFTFSPTYSHLGSYFINLPYMTFSIKQVGSHCIFIKYCLKKQQKQKQKQTNKHIFREWKYTENLPINTYQTEGTYYNFEWYPEKACSFLLFWLWYFCPRTCFLPIELSSFQISQY